MASLSSLMGIPMVEVMAAVMTSPSSRAVEKESVCSGVVVSRVQVVVSIAT